MVSVWVGARVWSLRWIGDRPRVYSYLSPCEHWDRLQQSPVTAMGMTEMSEWMNDQIVKMDKYNIQSVCLLKSQNVYE